MYKCESFPMRFCLHLCTYEKIEDFQLLEFEDPHIALVWMGKRAEGRIRDGAIDGWAGGRRRRRRGEDALLVRPTDRLSLSAGHISIFE